MFFSQLFTTAHEPCYATSGRLERGWGFVTGQVPLMGVASKDRDRANESSSKLNGQLWPIKEGRGTKGVGPGDGFAARTDTL